MSSFVKYLFALLAGLLLSPCLSYASSPLTIVYSGNNFGNVSPCPS